MFTLNVVTALLLIFWFGIPLMLFFAVFAMQFSLFSWSELSLLTVLILYPVAIGILYFAMGWNFFSVSPKVFLVVVSILPLLLGLVTLPYPIMMKASGKDPRLEVKNGVVKVETIHGWSGVIAEADPETFVLVENSEHYGKDKAHVFYDGKIVEKADPQSFRSVPEAGGRHFFRDDAGVFVNGKHVSDADPISFKSAGLSYYQDKNRVYYWDRSREEVLPLTAADPRTFHPLFRDKEKRIQTQWGKDLNTVFYAGMPVEGVDAPTFVIDQGPPRDKNKTYDNLEMILAEKLQKNN